MVLLMSAQDSHAQPGSAGPIQPVSLKCEFASDPLGIDVASPRLFWQVKSDQRGQKQTAWQVLVASSSDLLAQDRGDLWDSGRLESDQTSFIRYAGKQLASSQQVFWKVRVWDRDGKASEWSAPARWTMGLLSRDDWKGVWIGSGDDLRSMLLRREFTVRPGLRRAVVHVSGLGQYELSLNGTRVSNDLLAPGWTDYRDTILYDTHDVTAMLREGANSVGMILGNGMFHVVRPPGRFAKFIGSFGALRAILHLRLEYADGSVDYVGTDEQWRSNPGPLTFNSIYGGEDFDARLEPAGWNRAGFDDQNWAPVAKIPADQHLGALHAHSASAEPVKMIETRKPAKVQTFDDGTTVYDFGQNASFMPRVKMTGPAGSTIRLTPAEKIHADGTIYRGTMGSASRGSSWWQYTKATDAEETYFPKFYYLGSRYVRAEFLPANEGGARPKIESIEQVIVHSSAAPVGRFETSDPQLNRIRDLVRWAQRSNLVSIITDCPHREKLGWLEQMHLNGPALRSEFDMARLFSKSLHDMNDSQTPEGMVPNIAPEYTVFKGNFRAATEWGASFIMVPWQQYLFLGDKDLLERQYEPMKRYFAYLETRASGDIISDGLGDWYDVGPTRRKEAELTEAPVTATAHYFADAMTLSKIAEVLGKPDDARKYAAHAERIRASFNRAFFNREAGSYAGGSQCANALALAMGIVEPDQRARVVEALVKDIEQRNYAVTAGGVGNRYLLLALSHAGRSDVIHKMLHLDEAPGYAAMLRKGETSLTESWDSNLNSSHNHFMLGQITEWFYKDLAGIDVDPAGAGFQKILIRPNPVEGVNWVQAEYDSIRGPIFVRWERDGERFTLKTSIPANTTAVVYLPSREGASIQESGSPAERSPGVMLLGRDGGRAAFAIGSGSYVFESR